MFLIYHPIHAPTMPRSCGSLEEFEQLKANGWYTEGSIPSPIPPGDVPATNADDSNKPPEPGAGDASLSSEGNAGAREEEKVDDPADDTGKLLITDLNVGDARTVIADTITLDGLDALEKEETANKNRKGVFDAIEEQRNLIKLTDPKND